MTGLDLLVSVGTIGTSLVLAVMVLRLTDQRLRDGNRRVFVVAFPRSVTTGQVMAALRTLTGLTTPRLGSRGRDAAAFEVIGRRMGIEHRVRLPYGSADAYIAQLRAAIPGIAVTELDEADPEFFLTASVEARELRRTRTDAALAEADPADIARAVLASCSELKRGEQVVWQWCVTGGRPRPVGQATGRGWLSSLTGESPAPTPTLPKPYREGLIGVTGRLGATGNTVRASRHLVARLVRTSGVVSGPGARLVPRLLPSRLIVRRLAEARTPLVEDVIEVTLPELAGLLGLPIDAPMIPGLVLGRRPQLLAGPSVPRRGRTLGEATAGVARPVAQSLRGASEHTLIVGPTGSGKSWLAASMALEDIEAGRGVLVVDPKGGLIRDLLARMPEEAIERVVVVDPTDEKRPVPLPLLSTEKGGIPELAADSLVGLLRHRFQDIGPRSSDVISSSLYALARLPEASILDLFRLWTDAPFRAKVAGQCQDDPALRSFFVWFDGLSPTERNFVLAAPSNKLRPLIQRPVVRNVLAAPRPTFTMSEALSKRLIVLVSLPEGVLGSEATTLIGQVMLARLWTAIQARPAKSRSHRDPYLVTVDEAPRFVDQPTDLGEVLARSRGYGVGMTLVTQSLGQFPTTLREIALNSSRSKVAFQSSAGDARRLADEFGPTVTADMLTGLEPFTAIGAVSVGGGTSEPFTFATPTLPPVIKGRAAEVRKASRAKYGVDRREIEARFALRQEPPPEGTVGRRIEP